VQKARKDLQEASIDYGKAIDAKPTEKYFLEPQNRIDTALAHTRLSATRRRRGSFGFDSRRANTFRVFQRNENRVCAPADALTNDQVISMVSAGLDEANIIDTIKHAKAVNFDLSVQGQWICPRAR